MKRSNLKFDVSSVLQHAKKLPQPKVEGITVNLPFISVNLACPNKERDIAREVLLTSAPLIFANNKC